jgi:hypothetical protein
MRALLGGQAVAVLERETLVPGDRKLNGLEQRQDPDGDQHHGGWLVEAGRQNRTRDRLQPLAKPDGGAADGKQQQHHAGQHRSCKVGAPPEPMVASGLVFVHTSGHVEGPALNCKR